MDGREPNRVNAKPDEVVESCDNARQIAFAFAIAALETREDLVENRSLPPFKFFLCVSFQPL